MQNFRNSFSVTNLTRRTDQAHSPLHKAIFDMEEKRSNLFLDRRRIPGRKAKFLISLSVLFQFWGMKKIMEIKQFQANRDQELRKLQRKSAPFYQAMSDLRYITLEEKKNIIIEELFENKPEEYVKQITQRYHQQDIWAPFRNRYNYMYNKSNRNVRPYTDVWFARYLHGYDKYNV